MAAVYVSSSNRLDSKVPHALGGLQSPEFASLVKDTPGGESGIGMWLHGAEETRVVPVPDSQADRYAAALGAKYKQKAVLVWKHGAGDHELHIYPGLAKRKEPAEVMQMLQASGLPDAHTQTEEGDVHVVYNTPSPAAPVDGLIPRVHKGESKLIEDTEYPEYIK